MPYQFYNIGKANARISELEAENTSLKASTPDQQLQTRVDEAIASNDDISAQLTAATAENTKLKESVTELTNVKNSLGLEIAAVISALNEACVQMGVGSADAVAAMASADKIAALKNSVVKATASIGVSSGSIPSASVGTAPSSTNASAYKPKAIITNFKSA